MSNASVFLVLPTDDSIKHKTNNSEHEKTEPYLKTFCLDLIQSLNLICLLPLPFFL